MHDHGTQLLEPAVDETQSLRELERRLEDPSLGAETKEGEKHGRGPSDGGRILHGRIPATAAAQWRNARSARGSSSCRNARSHPSSFEPEYELVSSGFRATRAECGHHLGGLLLDRPQVLLERFGVRLE